MQDISATARVLGRNTAGAGDAEEITEAQFKTLFNLEIGTDVQAYDATTVLDADVTYELLNTNGDVGTTAGTLAIGDHLHTGVYEPADATIVKDADIGSTVQAYDVDTAKLDVVQSFTAEQTFKEYAETQYSLTGTVIDPANGTLQYKTLSANTTFTESLADGQSVTLMIDDGTAYTITWPTTTWVGGAAPTLPTTGYAVIELWQINAVLYGLHSGDA